VTRAGPLLAVALLPFATCGGTPPGFDQPAAALWDQDADVYLVSNVRGEPLAKDGDGYVAKVSPDGSMQRYWIAGGRADVVLHAPKGMAVHGDVLWVADIDTVRKFDRRSGAVRGEVAVPGAVALTDVAAGPDGTVWVSDPDAGAIHCIGVDGDVRLLAQGPQLGRPSALAVHGGTVYYVGADDGTFAMLDTAGRRTPLVTAPAGGLSGLVRYVPPPQPEDVGAPPRPVWLATSVAGSCVFRFALDGSYAPLPRRLEQPGDCDLDAVRGRLLVPLFAADRLEIVQL
jgi:hypothetical protein